MKISICILTYKRLELLKTLLDSLNKLQYNNLEVIVVDNHSEDGTQQFVKKNFPNIRYFCTDENIGVAARNIGFKMATGEVIIAIDDDISGIVDNDLSNLSSYFKKNKFLGALNFKVVDSYSGEVCNWIHHKKVEDYCDKTFETYEITEGAVAFRKNALMTAGLYPDYFFISHEGPDLSFRILNCGYDVMYSNMITVKHSHAEGGRKAWYRYYFDTRNLFYLAVRNFPFLYSLKFLIRGSLSLLVYSLRDGFLFYWFKGIVHGLKGIKKYSHHRKVLSTKTMKKIRCIDKDRPSPLYMAKKRLFRKKVRL